MNDIDRLADPRDKRVDRDAKVQMALFAQDYGPVMLVVFDQLMAGWGEA